MILTKKQLENLTKKQKEDLLMVLYSIEDRLNYKCKKVSKTIDFLQAEESEEEHENITCNQ